MTGMWTSLAAPIDDRCQLLSIGRIRHCANPTMRGAWIDVNCVQAIEATESYARRPQYDVPVAGGERETIPVN